MPISFASAAPPIDPRTEDARELAVSLDDVYQPRTSTGDVFAAAFRKENSLVSFATNMGQTGSTFLPVDGYDPFDKDSADIKGYEMFSKEFLRSESPEQTAAIKQSIDSEYRDRETLDSAGALGFAAQMAAGVTDPIYLLTMGTGVGATSFLGKGVLKTAARASAAGFVGEVLAEGAKQATQRTRTMEESMLNIGGATILSGILGGGLAGLSKVKANKAAKSIDKMLSDAEPEIVINGDIEASMRGSVQPEVPKVGILSFTDEMTGASGGQQDLVLTATKRGDAVGSISYTIFDDEVSIKFIDVPEGGRRKGTATKLLQELQGKFPDKEIDFGSLTDDGSKLVDSLNFKEIPLKDVQAKQTQLKEVRAKIAEFEEIQAEFNKIGKPTDAQRTKLFKDTDGWDDLTDLERDLAEFEGLSGTKKIIKETPLRPSGTTGDPLELVNAAKIEQWGVSPLVRTQTSEINATKQVVSEMMESPLVTKGNVEGIAASPPTGSVETKIKKWDAPLAESLTFMDDAYLKYRQGKGKINRAVNDYVLRNRAGKLSFGEFREEIGKAMRRGDTHDIPEVAEAARFMRKKIIDPLKDDAINLKMLPEDLEVKTAGSYLSRMYKTKKIISERDEWDGIVGGWLKRNREEALLVDPKVRTEGQIRDAGLTDADVDGVVRSITNNILGAPSGNGPYRGVKVPGALKERVFLIDDELIEDFLESDVDMVMRSYTRTLGPDVELTRQFGSSTLEKQIKTITSEWDDKIATAKTAKERTKLENRKRSDILDVTAMRDRLMGTYKMPEDPSKFWVRAGRAMRDINFLRMLGSMTLSAIPDLARPIAVNGLRPVAKGLVNLATSPKSFKLAREEAKKAAVGLDMVLNSRATSLAEITDMYARGTSLERGLRRASDAFGKISLMSQWNSAMKQFSGVITADRLLEVSAKAAAGKASKNEIRRMASAGIGKDMAGRIAKQFEEFGEDGTVKLMQGHLWKDQEAFEALQSAILKDVDRTIVTPGKGEAPLWTSSEMGKLVFQFKSFAGAAHHKILLADLQHRDSAALNGFLLSVALGSLSYGAKQYVAGREISTDPQKLIIEALDRSGGFGYFGDMNNMLEKATRGNLGINPMLGGPPMSRYVSRNTLGAFFGPSVGTAGDILTLTGAAGSGEFTKGDLRTLRKMMPGQNLFYMRKLLNELEDKAARSLPK